MRCGARKTFESLLSKRLEKYEHLNNTKPQEVANLSTKVYFIMAPPGWKQGPSPACACSSVLAQ